MKFRSPLRGPWLTSVLGVALLAALPLVIVTGLLDYVAYGPGQSIPGDVGLLHLPAVDWPTRPSWLFRLTQGLHVGLGLVLVPVVLAKLWSVIPRLFVWPPARSVAHALERATLLMLVGGILFEIVTGLMNIQYDYAFGFSFYTAHYIGAWVFLAGFVAHVVLKLPVARRALRTRSLRAELRVPVAATLPEPPDDGLGRDRSRPADDEPPRGVGAGRWGCAVRRDDHGGPDDRRPAARPRGAVAARPRGLPDQPHRGGRSHPACRHRRGVAADARRPELHPRRSPRLPQHTARLPIACVEGWSTVQDWTGVRLRDLAALAGVPSPGSAFVESLDAGPFGRATLSAGQVLDPDALLALRVNGADLSPDHGFPARVIVPALPGVHCTKWVRSITFRAA